MHNFCTLFDSNYLTRGIALYQSLEKKFPDFHLYIFAFDHNCYELLQELNFKKATIISLKEFESDDLLKVKPTRTTAEYCWTCTASTIWYSIHTYNLSSCTYLDADMLFFSSPQSIFNEIGTKSIAITPHDFSSSYSSSAVFGKYCVQFTYFKNDSEGLKALKWWKDSCIEWCYAKLEDGKYGDQKYLDYFEGKFQNICIISTIGSGIAPWNISNFNFSINNGELLITQHNKSSIFFPLIFYHFQGLKFKVDEITKEVNVTPAVKSIGKDVINMVYLPYINNLLLIKANIQRGIFPEYNIHFKNMMFQTIGLFFRNSLRKYKIVQFIYFKYLKKRYDKPTGLGGVID